jgi:hypothetical protein
MADMPPDVGVCTVRGKIAIAGQIVGTDPDPDHVPASGRVVFVPTVRKLLHVGSNTTYVANTVTAILDADGYFEVQLVATNDPDLQPLDWAYRVTFRLDNSGTMPSFLIAAPEGTVVDLASVSPIDDPLDCNDADHTHLEYLTVPQGDARYLKKAIVSATPPPSPVEGDLWVPL